MPLLQELKQVHPLPSGPGENTRGLRFTSLLALVSGAPHSLLHLHSSALPTGPRSGFLFNRSDGITHTDRENAQICSPWYELVSAELYVHWGNFGYSLAL